MSAKKAGESQHRVAFTLDPGESLVIDDPATVKVLYHPLRFQIVSMLNEPASVNEMASALDTSPNRLYYHVRELERHGLIKVGEERQARSNIEHAYVRAADQIELSGELARVTPPPHLPQAMQDAVRRYSKSFTAIERKRWKGRFSSTLNEAQGPLTAEQVEELKRRLQEVMKEFFSHQERKKGAVDYGLFYTIAPFPTDEQLEESKQHGSEPRTRSKTKKGERPKK